MIYFLRHGKDDERFIGGHSNVSLVPDGIMQVQKVTSFIKNNNIYIERIYTSDIRRAIETSLILNKYLNVDICEKKFLRELDKGLLTGLEIQAALKNFKEFMELNDINKEYPNGESMIQFYYRIKSNFNKIFKEDNTLFVTHRGVINMIYFILNNELPTFDKERFNVSYASLHEFDINKKILRKIYSP